MKAILVFDLSEDNEDFIIATHALDWALVCYDMSDKLRSYLKYGQEFKSADEALENIRDYLYESFEFHGVSLDMIP